jgi:DNA-binding NarL/FixJ family response regulator
VQRKDPAKRHFRVCLLSHHPLVLQDFERVLSGQRFRIQAHQLDSTLAPEMRHMRLPRAAIYVVDASMPRPAVEALIGGILEHFPTVRVVVVAEKFAENNSFSLLRLGAKGLVSYSEVQDQLPRAVLMVSEGGFWVSRSVLSRFVDSILRSARGRRIEGGTASDLSRREQEVLEALLENLANKEIAHRLHISERTVKFHVSNLLAKFGVRRRADLILLCYQRRSPGA